MLLLWLGGWLLAAVPDVPPALAQQVPAWMDDAGIPGLALTVVSRDDVAYLSLGVTCRDSATLVDDHTVFEAASLGKPVFAFAVMRLVDRGELDFDRPLADLVALPRIPHAAARTITPRMALSHTTGLPNRGGDELGVAFPPGTSFQYSGEGFLALQLAVEAMTGMALQEFMQREVFEPLQMHQSSFRPGDSNPDGRACPHWEHGPALPIRSLPHESAASSLVTTASDYGRFLRAVLRGDGLSPATRQTWFALETPFSDRGSPETQRHVGFALGFATQRLASGGHALWHWGDNGVSQSFVWVEPTNGLAWAYFANSGSGLAIARDFLAWSRRPAHCMDLFQYQPRTDPRFVARRELARLPSDAVDHSIALRTYAEGPLADSRDLLAAGLSLRRQHRPALAAQLLAQVPVLGADHRLALAQAQVEAGQTNAARATLSRGEDPRCRQLLQWLAPVEAGPTTPVPSGLVGVYGPHHVEQGEDGLVDRRTDTGYRRQLLHRPDGRFALLGQPWVRLEFQRDSQGRVVALIEHFAAGGQRRRPRDSGPETGH